MQTRHRSLLVAALFFSFATFLRGQASPDPSGHWEGTVKAPGHDVAIQIDLIRKPGGGMIGTLTGENVKGFPLSEVTVDGARVHFQLKVDGGGVFDAALGDAGTSIAGDFTTADGKYTIPFSLTRVGDVKTDQAVRNPPVTKQLEGTWRATLEANGVPMHVVLTLSNQADGTSTGTVANLDQGGVEIPITSITQQGSSLTLDVKVVSGTYSGAVNAEGTELAGTWTQGAVVAPLNFRRGDAGR